jgi:hypothetical protein
MCRELFTGVRFADGADFTGIGNASKSRCIYLRVNALLRSDRIYSRRPRSKMTRGDFVPASGPGGPGGYPPGLPQIRTCAH